MSAVRVLVPAAAALLLGVVARARVAPAPESSILASLLQASEVRDTLRGLATVRVSGAGRGGSFSQVVVVDLPDRARLEMQSTVGTAALVLTIAGEQLRYHSYLQHEYVTAPATLQTLDRLAGIPVPPGPLLRLLLGLTPLAVTRGDPRLVVEAEGAGFRVESVAADLSQRVWTGAGGRVERGELGQAGVPLLRFAFRDYRPVDGLPFPFELQMEEGSGARKLTVRYETVKLNEPIPADLFELPRPTDGRTKIRELRGGQ